MMIKKYFVAALLAAGTVLTSCDMDLRPIGSLDDQTAIQSVNDCLRFRNGLYSSLRGLTTGSYVYATDLQADEFHATTYYGNRMGFFTSGNILSSDGDITSYWSSGYSVINSANYLIERMQPLLANEEGLSQTDRAALERYNAEAHFIRAYVYYWLMQRFCENYSTETAQADHKGLPIVTVYNPTGNSSTYPARSTQDETYALIDSDLQIAYDGLSTFEQDDQSCLAPNASYLSTYAIRAFQARMALQKGDNTTALNRAEEVINSGLYPLTEIADYGAMWSEDTGSEVIFRPFMSATELGNSTGSTYLNTNLDNADYIPTADVLNLYGEGDIRFETFFTVWALSDQQIPAYVFHKYPGNESLMTSSTPNYMNMPKVFRTSEMYLIAAEAAIESNPTLANQYLNDLRSKRIEGYEAVTYSGMALRDAIRSERQKELVGEGFRLFDLRRWNLGFSRNPDHPENSDIANIMVPTSAGVSYAADDYRFVWPIPSDELQTNPQMAGQQNPGY